MSEDRLRRFREAQALRNKNRRRVYQIPPEPEPDNRPRRLTIVITYHDKRNAMNALADLRSRIEYDQLPEGPIVGQYRDAQISGTCEILKDDGGSTPNP